MPLQPGTLWAKLRNLKSPMKPPLWLLLAAFASIAVCEQGQGDLDPYSDNARQALTAKEWDEAAQALEHLVHLAPDVPEVYANLGLAYFFEGRPVEALAAF